MKEFFKDFLIVLAGFFCIPLAFWRLEIHRRIRTHEPVPAWIGIVIIALVIVIFLYLGLYLIS